MFKTKLAITIFFTAIILLVSHTLYFFTSPINITFDIKVPENQPTMQLQLAYQKEFRHKFKDKYRELVNISKNGKIKLEIPSLYVHKMRMIIVDINQSTLEISNLKINGKELKNLLKQGKWTFNNCQVKELDDGVLQIVANANDIEINVNKIWLWSNIDFDFKLFIIIGTIAFFVLFKLIGYLFAWKLEAGSSWLDILLVGVFFVMLFVPMLKISDEKVSVNEKRSLATIKPLIDENGVNRDFGKNFDAFFNDRFFGRKTVINRYSELKKFINGNLSKNIKGLDGWRFYNTEGFNGYEDFQNKNMFTEADLQRIANYLTSIDEYCREHNKQFYYYIAPNKSKIYGEFFDPKVIQLRKDSENKTVQLVDYLRKNTNVKVIYPIEILLNAKKDNLIYYKNDVHWTTLGAYLGYLELMKELQKDFEDAKIVEPIKYEMQVQGFRGDLVEIEEKDNKRDSFMTPVFAKNSDVIFEKDILDLEAMSNLEHEVFKNPKGQYSIIVYRDSFAAPWGAMLANNFKLVDMNWRYQLLPKDIAKIKNFDIVVLEQLDTRITELLQFEFSKEQ